MASPTTSVSISTITNSVAAGYAAGICGVVVGHPLDSVKVLLQTGGRKTMSMMATPGHLPSPTSPVPPSAGSAFSAASGGVVPLARAASVNAPASFATAQASTANIVTVAAPSPVVAAPPSSRSIRALYAGISGPLMSIGIIQSVNFALYDSFRRSLHKREHPEAPRDDYLRNDSYQHVALASFGAGGIISLLTSPLQVVKTKQQIMVWSFRKAAADTLSGGMRNFFTGFVPHLFCDSVGRMVYFTSYEMMKRGLAKYRAAEMETDQDNKTEHPIGITLPERMACAALSGMACWSVIFPMDVTRCKMYAESLSEKGKIKTLDIMRSTYDEKKSLRPFFRGFGVTVLRAGPVAAAVMPVYDLTLEW
eukprot:CAMPEP_0183301462 /NCGR_PEP_ID=MMETSP0160_2-20130417/7570_1 /TAXON_ID=2839 ORGANISM="Odontella Sinensis, Strain Grunow 1884" /NCGR_SAMPLE_ID=MMETSP0160_2 /ASSEMBLY_ACC=CAM_ASM_000250 /LENGTH=364 /DNA_ID=CAMNT_0025464091 /DNA_START=16 /DNA_END=1107 /DNA_ORIENTATION=+